MPEEKSVSRSRRGEFMKDEGVTEKSSLLTWITRANDSDSRELNLFTFPISRRDLKSGPDLLWPEVWAIEAINTQCSMAHCLIEPDPIRWSFKFFWRSRSVRSSFDRKILFPTKPKLLSK